MEPVCYEVVCVSTSIDNIGYKRFIDTCYKNNINVKTLGMDNKWEGGDMNAGKGGGQKVNLLRDYLNTQSKQLLENIIILTDSYDVLFETDIIEIQEKINRILEDHAVSLENMIIFSSEKVCWPDKNLECKFPKTEYDYNYLNSGGFVCKASTLKTILKNIKNIKNDEDDQEYYTKLYIELQNSNSSVLPILDSKCKIFQTLNNSYTEVKYNKTSNRLTNICTNTEPCIIHANGPTNIKKFLNDYYDNQHNKVFYKTEASILYY